MVLLFQLAIDSVFSKFLRNLTLSLYKPCTNIPAYNDYMILFSRGDRTTLFSQFFYSLGRTSSNSERVLCYQFFQHSMWKQLSPHFHFALFVFISKCILRLHLQSRSTTFCSFGTEEALVLLTFPYSGRFRDLKTCYISLAEVPYICIRFIRLTLESVHAVY